MNRKQQIFKQPVFHQTVISTFCFHVKHLPFIRSKLIILESENMFHKQRYPFNPNSPSKL